MPSNEMKRHAEDADNYTNISFETVCPEQNNKYDKHVSYYSETQILCFLGGPIENGVKSRKM